MPRMSGYEVCQKIRRNKPPHELPIIFLTAKNQTADMVTSFKSGGNDFPDETYIQARVVTPGPHPFGTA